jgi:hypothetical protein
MVLARTVVRRMRALFQPPTDDHAISALQAFGWHALTGTNDVAADGGLCANRPVVAPLCVKWLRVLARGRCAGPGRRQADCA